jgi:fucose permease
VALSAATFTLTGACLTLPGTLLPILLEQFQIRLVEAGSMFALQPIGYLLSVLAAAQLIGRFGMRAMLAAALCTSAVGLVGFGLVSHWVVGAVMMCLFGLGLGIFEVAANMLLIIIGGERRANVLNLAHLFFGVGSFIGPLLSTRAVAAGLSWRVTFAIGGAAVAGVSAGWSLLRLDAIAPRSPGPPDGSRHTARRSRLALLLALLLAVYVGVEMGVGAWLTKYMVAVRATTLVYAGNTLSLYWLGLAAGRLILSRSSHYFREETLNLVLALGAAGALTAALLVPGPATATACFALAGLGFSGIFPAAIALGGRYHPHDTAGATSVMVAGAGLGGIVIPWLMSAVADRAGLVAGMIFYVAVAAGLVILALVVKRAIGLHSHA